MFGTYRFILANFVVFGHLGGVFAIGSYAVFSFYTLSGYLMTLIMHSSYGYTGSGVFRYAVNRILRIYPPYWFACALSIMLIHLMGDDVVKGYHQAIFLPENAKQLLSNILLLFQADSVPRLAPPAWALSVELFYYICIGAGFSRTKFTTVVWLILSIFYTISINVYEMGWYYVYSFIAPASLPFSTGAFIYHFKTDIKKLLIKNRYINNLSTICGFLILNYIVSKELNCLKTYGFYINYFGNIILISFLILRNGDNTILNRIDKVLGNLSYPIYLSHYQCGLILIMFDIFPYRGTILFSIFSLPLVILTSYVINILIESPIEVIRKRIRKLRYSILCRQKVEN